MENVATFAVSKFCKNLRHSFSPYPSHGSNPRNGDATIRTGARGTYYIRARLMIHWITEERCRGIRELCNWQGMLSTAYSNSRKDVRGERNGDKAALRFLRKTRVAVGHGNSDDFERAAGVIGTGANYRRVTEIKASHRTEPRVYTH